MVVLTYPEQDWRPSVCTIKWSLLYTGRNTVCLVLGYMVVVHACFCMVYINLVQSCCQSTSAHTTVEISINHQVYMIKVWHAYAGPCLLRHTINHIYLHSSVIKSCAVTLNRRANGCTPSYKTPGTAVNITTPASGSTYEDRHPDLCKVINIAALSAFHSYNHWTCMQCQHLLPP